jgi:hypothetical protein
MLAALLACAACSQEIQSPDVKLTRLDPDLFCSEKWPGGRQDVKVIGEGFTPMPFNVLDETELELPTVTLTRGFNVRKEPQPGDPITFSGAPDGENHDKLSWQSDKQMTITFDDGTAPPNSPSSPPKPDSGLYRVKVTQPDGVASAEKNPIGFAIVNPPTTTNLIPPSLCNAFLDETLTIEGTDFIKVGAAGPTVHISGNGVNKDYAVEEDRMQDCVVVEGLSSPVEICDKVSITVLANDLPTGDFDVSLTNPVPVDCASDPAPQKLKVLNSGPVLFYSDPPVVFNGINTKITLYVTTVTEPFTVEIAPTGLDEPRTLLDSELLPTAAGTTNRIQAGVPSDTLPGTYDVILTDGTGCAVRLTAGLIVTGDLTLTITSIDPNFGDNDETVSVVIQGTGFEATPRAFLNPVSPEPGAVAIQIQSITWNSGTQLTAVVPKIDLGTSDRRVYDLIVVNPGGQVGRAEAAYTAVQAQPPVISDVVPQSIVDASGQTITVQGTGFSGATVSLECRDSGGNDIAATVTNTPETCESGICTVTATITTALPQGSVCVVVVSNADGSFGRFSAIGVTNSSFNLSSPTAGPPMTVPRRALVSAAAKATAAQRFVYAIGGDDGGQIQYSSVEFAPVSPFGVMSTWTSNRESLVSARAFAGIASVGRYIYVFGGTADGSAALASGERALILSPEESPAIEDVDLCLSGGATPCYGDATLGVGLAEGQYSYRVSAMISPTDPVNLGGETLASDPIIIKLPTITATRAIVVKVSWSPPLDSQGVELSGITGYRIYRTLANGVPGAEELLVDQINDASAREYIDDGSKIPAGGQPLVLGSTSAWQALPNLGTARNGPAGAAARDPSGNWYVYALLGKDSGAETGGAGIASYEYLPINTAANGRQSVATAWTAGQQASAVGRWQLGAWVVDSVTASAVSPPDNFVYIGGGKLGSGATNGRVEAGKVIAGGDLGILDDTPRDFSNDRAGYGIAAAAGRLFAFGGSGGHASGDAVAAQITGSPGLAANAWNNEGLSLTVERYLMGSSIQSAFIFLVGGADTSGAALASTETVVW